MIWESLYPIVKEQAYCEMLKYEESDRRKNKIQELVSQSCEKFQSDTAAGKVINKQDYKCFVTQRAKEVDKRCFRKKGCGGTSAILALSFCRRRSDSEALVIEFDV